jgi:outer membrane protein assembly factor BamD (BamD/ComL family)
MPAVAKPVAAAEIPGSNNWLIYHHYASAQYEDALKLADEAIEATDGTAEYAIYVKGEWVNSPHSHTMMQPSLTVRLSIAPLFSRLQV